MDRKQKVAAGMAGAVVIILLIILAKWTGDQIRGKFLTPKVQTPSVASPVKLEPTTTARETTAYSTIPETGPKDLFLLVAGSFIGAWALWRVNPWRRR